MGHSSEDNTSDVPSELTETESDMEEGSAILNIRAI